MQVATTDASGRGVDKDAALEQLAARPYGHLVRYLGTARGVLWFEYDPAELKR